MTRRGRLFLAVLALAATLGLIAIAVALLGQTAPGRRSMAGEGAVGPESREHRRTTEPLADSATAPAAPAAPAADELPAGMEARGDPSPPLSVRGDRYPEYEPGPHSGGIIVRCEGADPAQRIRVAAIGRARLGQENDQNRRAAPGHDAVFEATGVGAGVFVAWFGTQLVSLIATDDLGHAGRAEGVRLANPGEEPPTVSLTLAPLGNGSIEGRVRWADGPPAAGLTICVGPPGASAGRPLSPSGVQDLLARFPIETVTGDDGTFRLRGLVVGEGCPLGVYDGDNLLAQRLDLRTSSVPTSLAEIVIERRREVLVTLRFAGQPVCGIPLTIAARSLDRALGITDQDGRARLLVPREATTATVVGTSLVGTNTLAFGRALRQGRNSTIMQGLLLRWLWAAMSIHQTVTIENDQTARIELRLDDAWGRTFERPKFVVASVAEIRDLASREDSPFATYPPGMIRALRLGDLTAAMKGLLPEWNEWAARELGGSQGRR